MFNYKKKFMEYLSYEDIIFQDLAPNTLLISYEGQNLSSIAVQITFDGHGDGLVSFHSWSLGRIPDGKLAPALWMCNELNNTFRWVRFYIDTEEEEIVVAADAVVEPDTVGAECNQIVSRMVDICEKAYPKLMEMIWKYNS